MDANATPETPAQPANDAAQPPAPEPRPAPPAAKPAESSGGKRERKGPSPEQSRRAASQKKLKRRLEKLLAEGDADAIEAAASLLEGEGGSPATASQAEASAAAAAEASATPAEKPTAHVPTAEELAAMLGLAAGIVAMVAEPLAGTRYDPMKPRPNPLGGEAIVPGKALTEAMGPVLAKYLPAAVGTPEGQLVMCLAMWLVPPTLEVVKEKALGKGKPPDGGALGVA